MKPNSVYGVKFSELIALKQAEAESAKIKQKYTQQETALLKQKAESEAIFQVLSRQKAFEAAAAKIKHEALMAKDYEKKHIVSFSPFTAFVEFIRDQATICKL
ncbi:hypothetical protein DPMN_089502 [Dreissena polymorpha]|uniref:Uncharacterized protein n=1 Tax=Dreissena polymorpha TaxID=45954 RepID=A0A9D4QYX7_DREPO|nr:hypothetical protein DPMN_089502 [Dreissena polymorpha]